MSLIICNECANEVSSQAKTCPKCGYRIKPVSIKLIGFFISLIVILALILADKFNFKIFDNTPTTSAPVSTPAPVAAPPAPIITKSATEAENLFLLRALEMTYAQWPQLNETSDIFAVHKWISGTRYLLSSVQGRVEGQPEQLDPRINSLYKKCIELLTKYDEVLVDISSIKGVPLNSGNNVSDAVNAGTGAVQVAMMTGIGTAPALAVGALIAVAGMAPDPNDDIAEKNQKEHIRMRVDSINSEFQSIFRNAKVLANELKNDDKYQWRTEVGFDDSLTTGVSIAEQNKLRPRDPFVLLLLAKNNLQVPNISKETLKLNSLQVYKAANNLVPFQDVYKPFKAELIFYAAELVMAATQRQTAKGSCGKNNCKNSEKYSTYSAAPVPYAKDAVDLYKNYLQLAPNGNGTKYEYVQLAKALAMDGKYLEAIDAANAAMGKGSWKDDRDFYYRYARFTSLANRLDYTGYWLKRAYSLGWKDVQFVRDDPDLKNFRESKPGVFKLLTTVKTEVTIEFGVLNDDIILENRSPFPITNVRLTGKIRQNDMKEWPFDLSSALIKPYDKYKWTNVVSITDSKFDSLRARVTCDQQSPLC